MGSHSARHALILCMVSCSPSRCTMPHLVKVRDLGAVPCAYSKRRNVPKPDAACTPSCGVQAFGRCSPLGAGRSGG
eukprot:1555301-Prymnesium_polylepis.1